MIMESEQLETVKRNKKGIIYLSCLPKYLNVIKLREIMENFGEVGRIFLQPQKTGKLPYYPPSFYHLRTKFTILYRTVLVNKKKPAKHFTEGWVEFEKKRVAKEVAAGLNGRKIECRKKSKYYDFIWSVKYLSK